MKTPAKQNQISHLDSLHGLESVDDLYGVLRSSTDRAIAAAAIKALRRIADENEGAEVILPTKMLMPQREPGFSMYVLDIFHIKTKGVVVAGVASSGTLKEGDPLVLEKANGRDIDTVCTGLDIFTGTTVEAGAQVGVHVDIAAMEEIEQGDLLVFGEHLQER